MPALLSERCDGMNEPDIRRYAELMKELELTGLEVTEDSGKIRLERTAPGTVREVRGPAPEAAGAAGEISSGPKDYIRVTSPMVGIFYAAPAENAAPYVSVGDTVTKGQPLCVVEAMKMMNEITAEEDGTISEICVTNGNVVEYGTELFRIRR